MCAIDAAWLVYSSAQARDDEMRRSIVFLLTERPFLADWHDAQFAFFDFMKLAGVTMDGEHARAAHPENLPNDSCALANFGTFIMRFGERGE